MWLGLTWLQLDTAPAELTHSIETFVLFCAIQKSALQRTLLLHVMPTQTSEEPVSSTPQARG
jgi:hypothetical protein